MRDAGRGTRIIQAQRASDERARCIETRGKTCIDISTSQADRVPHPAFRVPIVSALAPDIFHDIRTPYPRSVSCLLQSLVHRHPRPHQRVRMPLPFLALPRSRRRQTPGQWDSAASVAFPFR